MKNSYLTAGIGLKNLFRLLGRNGFTPSPRYLFRVLFLFQAALWSSLFGLLERWILGKKIMATPPPLDPVFIIGHWRTGSTFLHQLMTLDPENTTPTLFQVALPGCFILSAPFYRPVMGAALGKHRPMDKVKLGMDEPQEDEYAIYRLTTESPLEQLVFPDGNGFFLNTVRDFYPQGKKLDVWIRTVTDFFRKLRYTSGKRIVSKNPFNSMRVRLLSEMFPESRFISIIRNPLDVIPSSINMWTIVQQQNSLKRGEHRPTIQEILSIYRVMTEEMETGLLPLPESRKVTIRYEDLEHDPVSTLQRIYLTLGMNFTPAFEKNISEFLNATGPFEKNRFFLTEEERVLISSELKDHMKVHGYI